jgi:hypothetical protein
MLLFPDSAGGHMAYVAERRRWKRIRELVQIQTGDV